MEKHTLQKIAEDCELNVRSYSGRAMYGRTCLGIEADSISSVIAAVMDSLIDVPNIADQREVAEAFQDMRMDNMGMGIIVYFPRIQFVEDEISDDEIEEFVSEFRKLGDVGVKIPFTEDDEHESGCNCDRCMYRRQDGVNDDSDCD